MVSKSPNGRRANMNNSCNCLKSCDCVVGYFEFNDSLFPREGNSKRSIGQTREKKQLLQLCTARTAWSDSVIRSETSSITESDRSGPIR